MAYTLKATPQSRKAPILSKLADMTAAEASQYGPYGKGDTPCIVECGGRRTQWKSRRAAKFFYSVAAKMCEGSESARYSQIANGLDGDSFVASDGIPVMAERNSAPVADTGERIRALYAKKRLIERLMDTARESGLYETAQRFADQRNDITIEIIRLERVIIKQ